MPRNPGEGRREQILDAALHVFAWKGFARASIRDVAGEAGISTGLIYYYFENKKLLLQTMRPFHSGGKLNAWLRRITIDAYKQRGASLSASKLFALFWNGPDHSILGANCLLVIKIPPVFPSSIDTHILC